MKMEMRGLAELQRNLRNLPVEVQGRPIRSALSAAAKVTASYVVANAPVDETPDGLHIKDNIEVGRSRRKSGPGVEVFSVGVKIGKKKSANAKGSKTKARVGQFTKKEGDVFYWRYYEFGSSHQDARPFFVPAAEASKIPALTAFETSMAKAITRLAKKYSVK